MKLLINPIKQSILILLTLLFVISCKEENQSTNTLLQEYKEKIDALQKENKILQEQLAPRSNKKPNNIIQSDFAQEIYHLYDKREALINKVVGEDREGNEFRATRSLFYDIDDLYDYLSYIKKLSEKAEVQPSGLRFYFALYPDDYTRKGKDKKYAKRQTFFIAPTKEVKDAQGNIKHLGYTLDNSFKPILLQEKLDFEQHGLGFNTESFKHNNYQKAGFFNFTTNALFQEENSLIANEFTGTPPKGNE